MPKRRGHGEGSIYQRKDGRWVVSINLGTPGERRKRRDLYFETEAEAVAGKTELLATLAAGLPVPDGKLTVGQWLDRWLGLMVGDVEPNTLDNYGWGVGHITPEIGRIKLVDLKPSQVSSFLKEKSSAGYSKSSLRRMRAVLVQAIKAAEVEGIVHRNVASLVSTPPGETKPGRSLTPEQAEILLERSMEHPRGPAFVVALTFGLRPGEVLGLLWDDVDLETPALHIRQALISERTGLRLGKLKTAGSRRSLGIPPSTVAILKQHRRRQLTQRLALGNAWQDWGLVFPTEIGTPIDPANFRRTFRRITSDAGFGNWTPNELRHSTVSFLSAGGVPIEEISDVTGHDSTRMTAGVYRHLLTPVVSVAVDPMERILGGGNQ